MRRTAFSIALAAEMFVLTGVSTAQNSTPSQPPANPSSPSPTTQPPDRSMDPAERDRQQKEWDAMKKEWDALTPEARILSVIHAKNVKEIELGRMGQQRGSSPSVKEYASMMVKDHTEADSKLTTLATSEKITLWDTEKTGRALKFKKMFGKDQGKDKDHDAKDHGKRDPNKPGAHPEDRRPDANDPRHDDDHMGKRDARDPAEKLGSLSGEEFDNAFARVMHMGHAELLQILEKSQPELTNANVKGYVSEVTATVRKHRDSAAGMPGAKGDERGNKDKDKDKPRKDSTDPKKDPAVKDPHWDR